MFQIQRYLLTGLAASICFLLIYEIGVRFRNERVTWFHRAMVLLAGLYLMVVFAITVSPGSAISLPHSGNSINLIPFQVLDEASFHPLNFWGNIALFMPLGIFLVLLFNQCQRLFYTLLIGAGMSLLIELLQLFQERSTDVDDIILNTTGTLFGYLIGKAILSFIPLLRNKVGICKRENGKLIRKRHDAGRFTLLSVFILASVLLAGYVELNEKDILLTPVMSMEDPLISEQLPEVHESRRISVDIDATNAYLWEVSSNTVLYEKESEARIAPASTAKILTALTVLEYCEENDLVTVGNEVQLIAADASRAWLYPGNELTVRQLLDALLLPSGNDAAYALAVFTGRRISRDDTVSIEDALAAFMKAMNEKAAEIGAVHSCFAVPDGYDTDGQYTTAQDLALLAGAFLKSDILREIAGSFRLSDVWLSGQEVTYYNTNELINPESPYYYECAAGLKTGKSETAGCCLISCADIDDKLYVCVVMGSTEEGRWQDSIKLYDAISQ